MIALVRVTFGTAEKAERVIRTAIEERLAACANIEPCQSIYRWQGQIEAGAEVSVTFKTLPGLADALARRLGELHDYELPAIEWWSVDVPAAVDQWVRNSCR